VQPVTGFHVASVHSIGDFSAMRFALSANRITAGLRAGSANCNWHAVALDAMSPGRRSRLHLTREIVIQASGALRGHTICSEGMPGLVGAVKSEGPSRCTFAAPRPSRRAAAGEGCAVAKGSSTMHRVCARGPLQPRCAIRQGSPAHQRSKSELMSAAHALCRRQISYSQQRYDWAC